MKNQSIVIKIILLVIFCSVGYGYSQNKDSDLTSVQINRITKSISNILTENYVFPEVSNKMNQKIKEQLKEGIYNTKLKPNELADLLTQDLQSISKDKHLRVIYNPRRASRPKEELTASDSIRLNNRRLNRMKDENFGFKEVKILKGNIGYVDLRAFMETEHAGNTATAAMNFLSNTNAIIFDLRQNGGGSASMIQLITSYLFKPEPVHLNNFYWKPTNTTTQTWTLPHVSGKRNTEAEVYILTSNITFSAAEEFSYDLKHLKRATLIGETTGGGAHPGGIIEAVDGFMVWTPSGRAINPITKTNWEGVGVVPHIKVDSKNALIVARIKALESLISKTNDDREKFNYNWSLDEQKALLEPVIIEQEKLESYEGFYGERKISLINKKLHYQRNDSEKYKLIPINQEEFMIQELPYFRIKFVVKDSKITAIEGLYDNGRKDMSLRSK